MKLRFSDFCDVPICGRKIFVDSCKKMSRISYYIICRNGSLYSVWNNGHIKKSHPRVHSNGYLRYVIGYKDFYAHRIVAKAFIPNPQNLLEINHKDCNRKNPCVENLEWCSRKYNCKYAFDKGGINKDFLKKIASSKSHEQGTAKLRKLEPFQDDFVLFLRQHGCSLTKISKVFGISRCAVYNASQRSKKRRENKQIIVSVKLSEIYRASDKNN